MTNMENAEMTGKKLNLKIDGEGVSINQEISMDLLPTILSLIFESAANQQRRFSTTIASHSHVENGLTVGRDAGLSPAEFLQEKGAKTNPDMILVLGRYAEQTEGKDTFSRENIRKLMKLARVPEPRNFHRDFGVALSRGYIQTVDDDKSFHVTTTGIRLVDQPGPIDFPRGQAAPRRVRRRQRRTDAIPEQE